MLPKRFLQPKTIAVFGGKEGREVIGQCDRMGFKGEIWPVHPVRSEINGRTVYRSVHELPGSPDAAYIAINRDATLDIVGELANCGAGGAVCYATGFSEAGNEGSVLEQKLLERSKNMALLGPNCYGFLNYVHGAALWSDQQGGRRVSQGVALITMSSNIAFNLTMQLRGLPVAYLVSLGNGLKFNLADAIASMAERDEVTAIGLYIEGLGDPIGFEQAVMAARQREVPVVALKSGRSDRAQSVVMSHTAALSGSDSLIDSLFDRIGVARVDYLAELLEALKLLHIVGPIQGRGIGALSTSGGDLALLADTLDAARLNMPTLSDAGAKRLAQTLHERVVIRNPLDYQMFDWGDEQALQATYKAFLGERYDLTVSMLDFPRSDRCDRANWTPAVAALRGAQSRDAGPVALMTTLSDNLPEDIAIELADNGIAPLAGIQAGVAGIGAAIRVGEAWARAPMPALISARYAGQENKLMWLDEPTSKAVLTAHGVPVPPSRQVTNSDDAVAAAQSLGYPVVVKAVGVAHKTDAGAVRVNLKSADAVAQAVYAMRPLSAHLLVETMVDDAVAELLIGVNQDEQFGTYLVIGAGGILVELLRDSRALLLPVTRESVARAIASLTIFPLLQGFRGRPRGDLEALVDSVMAIGELVVDHPAQIIDLDINPLLVRPRGSGVAAADALVGAISTEGISGAYPCFGSHAPKQQQ